MEKTIYLKNDDVIRCDNVHTIELDDGFFMMYSINGEVLAAVASEHVDYIL